MVLEKLTEEKMVFWKNSYKYLIFLFIVANIIALFISLIGISNSKDFLYSIMYVNLFFIPLWIIMLPFYFNNNKILVDSQRKIITIANYKFFFIKTWEYVFEGNKVILKFEYKVTLLRGAINKLLVSYDDKQVVIQQGSSLFLPSMIKRAKKIQSMIGCYLEMPSSTR